MQDAINLALKNNFDIQLAKNNVEIANINNSYGVAGGLPTVNGTLTDQEQIQNIRQESANQPPRIANAALGNALSANVTGSILLFNGMRVVATKKRLDILENQNQQQLNVQIQNTISQVMVIYFDIIRQKSYQKTIERSIVASETKLNIVENQQKAGLSNNADLFQAQVDLNNLKQTFISQQLVLTQSQTDFLTLLNVPAENSYEINDSIVVDKTIKIDSILSFIDKNPAIVAAGMQVKINEQIVKETAAQRYPSLRLNAGYNVNRQQSAGGFFLLQQTYGPFVSVGLTVPIYNGDIFRKQQQVARINTTTADIQKKALERNFQATTVKMWQSYISNLQQLETGIENYKIASKLLDLVVKRFELQQATIIEVKNAQQSFENAGYLIVNLNYAAKAAEIELKRISNQLRF
jgi:outer membrane protein